MSYEQLAIFFTNLAYIPQIKQKRLTLLKGIQDKNSIA